MIKHINNPTRIDAEYRQILKKTYRNPDGICKIGTDRVLSPNEQKEQISFRRSGKPCVPKFDYDEADRRMDFKF